MNQSLFIKTELEKFKSHQKQFHSKCAVASIDPHGFTTSSNPDLLIIGLTHGNEVIGLEVINLFLDKILSSKAPQKHSFAVLLGNVKAYEQNMRYTERDLNRSFNVKENKTYEHQRANEIQDIIRKLKPKFILDLHQISEPTHGSFFILPEDPNLIRYAHAISQTWPIVTFDAKGFSVEGETLLEFSKSISISALVIEISQNGFNVELAQQMADLIYTFNLEKILAKTNNTDSIDYYKITHQLLKEHRDIELVRGLVNLDPVKKNNILGYFKDKIPYISPVDGLLIFPKYDEMAKASPELGLIATKTKL